MWLTCLKMPQVKEKGTVLMARIILGASMVRYPVGGIHQWIVGWLLGFKKLGHEVYFVEKSGWPDSCYDLSKRIMTDDCSYGVGMTSTVLRRSGIRSRV